MPRLALNWYLPELCLQSSFIRGVSSIPGSILKLMKEYLYTEATFNNNASGLVLMHDIFLL
jgi:hypothetical protein